MLQGAFEKKFNFVKESGQRVASTSSLHNGSVIITRPSYIIFIQIEKKDIKVCAKEAEECATLRAAYAACKRGQLDPRTRIRGNKGY